MPTLTSYGADIRPLFTDRDIHAMSKAFNLASYDEGKAHTAVIYDRIRGIGGAVIREVDSGWLPAIEALNAVMRDGRAQKGRKRRSTSMANQALELKFVVT